MKARRIITVLVAAALSVLATAGAALAGGGPSGTGIPGIPW